MVGFNTVAVLGLGAVGSVVACGLSKVLVAPGSLRVIADGKRAKRIKREGITLSGRKYDFEVVDPYAPAQPVGLAIVALKGHQLQAALPALRNQVGEDTVIMSLMNGITSEDVLASAYGKEKLIYSITAVNCTKKDSTVSYSPGGRFTIGEESGAVTARIQAVQALFEAAGMKCVISKNIVRDLWFKFMMNTSGNPVEAILRGKHEYYHLYEEANLARLCLAKEILAISKAAGTGLTEADVESARHAYDGFAPEAVCSMAQDMQAGRPMEVETFLGDALRLGKEYGVATPVCEFAYYLLSTLNNINIGRRTRDFKSSVRMV